MFLSCCPPSPLAALTASPPGAEGGPDVGGGEANLVLPDLSGVLVSGGLSGRALLLVGICVCLLGLSFGTVTFLRLSRAPVHSSMLEVAETI